MIYCYGLTLPIAQAATVPEMNRPWLMTALKLQREIDLDVPLNEATFLGTHNSFNSKSYQITLVRYMDPNQTLSIAEQLDAGVRSIELDAHWTLNNKFTYEILLCHGQPTHFGCSIFDRPFGLGLQELRDWLKANPGELVLLYIERHLNGHEAKMAALLHEYLDDYIFKPSTIKNNADNHECTSLPTNISKADILRTGKQLIIVTKECDRNKTEINDYVFMGIGDIPAYPYTFIDSKLNAFTNYPDCGKSKIFGPDPNHTSLWRIMEDRTLIGGMAEPQKWLYDQDMHELLHCGINWPTVDMLAAYDSRLFASIWSWAVNYPQPNQGNCAMYKYDEGFKNMPCKKILQAYTCKEANTHAIKVVSLLGTWGNGEAICQLSGKNWHFSVPINGHQLSSLKDSMKELLVQEVWLNYAIDQQGNWRANPQSTKHELASQN